MTLYASFGWKILKLKNVVQWISSFFFADYMSKWLLLIFLLTLSVHYWKVNKTCTFEVEVGIIVALYALQTLQQDVEI